MKQPDFIVTAEAIEYFGGLNGAMMHAGALGIEYMTSFVEDEELSSTIYLFPDCIRVTFGLSRNGRYYSASHQIAIHEVKGDVLSYFEFIATKTKDRVYGELLKSLN